MPGGKTNDYASYCHFKFMRSQVVSECYLAILRHFILRLHGWLFYTSFPSKLQTSVSHYRCQLSTVFSMYLRKQKQSIPLIPMTMPSYLPAFVPIYSAFHAVTVNKLSILSFSICRLDPIPCCFSHYFSCITILQSLHSVTFIST